MERVYISKDKKVIFDGPKCFWKTKHTLDVIIIEHVGFNVIEVVAYDPVSDVEAPRLYLDDRNLRSKIDVVYVEKCIHYEKEIALRRKQAPDIQAYRSRAVDQARVDYILNRLVVEASSSENRILVVEIKFTLSDQDDERHVLEVGQMVISPPDGLLPFEKTHKRSLM